MESGKEQDKRENKWVKQRKRIEYREGRWDTPEANPSSIPKFIHKTRFIPYFLDDLCDKIM